MIVLWGNSRIMVWVNGILAVAAGAAGAWMRVRTGTWAGLALAAFFSLMAATSWLAWKATQGSRQSGLQEQDRLRRSLICPDCGHENQVNWVFCTRCGYRR